MKKILLITMLGMFSLSLMAQHETIFNKARVVGGFGGPIVEFGLNNKLNTSVGGGGGLIINSFFIGGYGLGSVDFDQLIETDDVDVLDIGHGGFWLGGTFRPHKVIHAYGSARIGWGAVNVELNDTGQTWRDLDKIFVLTPEIGVELNLTKWFRVAGTVGYRYVSGTNEARGYTDDDFSEAIAGVTLRFGWFGWRRN